MAQRIQRNRSTGWTTPLCACGCGRKAIYVGRPGGWGNPFRIGSRYDLKFDDGHRMGEINSRQDAVAAFVDCLWGHYECNAFSGYPTIAMIRDELRGHDLMCWCPLGSPCHADVLLEVANRGEL